MPNEEALKQLIASLPNPDQPDDWDHLGLGEGEWAYLCGLRDALKIMEGDPSPGYYTRFIRQCMDETR